MSQSKKINQISTKFKELIGSITFTSKNEVFIYDIKLGKFDNAISLLLNLIEDENFLIKIKALWSLFMVLLRKKIPTEEQQRKLLPILDDLRKNDEDENIRALAENSIIWLSLYINTNDKDLEKYLLKLNEEFLTKKSEYGFFGSDIAYNLFDRKDENGSRNILLLRRPEAVKELVFALKNESDLD
ncbi:MAG: HEAT repeat domain-containing protein, partial [Candidatus Heimdallarchaeota archaeon]